MLVFCEACSDRECFWAVRTALWEEGDGHPVGDADWIRTPSWGNRRGPRICPIQPKIQFLRSLYNLFRVVPRRTKLPQPHCTRFIPSCSVTYLWWLRRELEASLPAVCCVWTPSTGGRGPSVPSSSKARMGFKGISGLSLLATSNLDGLDPMGKFIISSKFSFWTDTPFSLGCFSKLGVLGNLKNQNWKELALKLKKKFF